MAIKVNKNGEVVIEKVLKVTKEQKSMYVEVKHLSEKTKNHLNHYQNEKKA